MALDQPQADFPLPSDIKQYAERVRAQVAVEEIGLNNLKREKYGIEQTISGLLTEKKDIEEKITSIKHEEIELTAINNSLKKENERLAEDTQKLGQLVDERRQFLTESELNFEKATDGINARLSKLENAEQAFNEEKSEFQTRKSEFEKFVSRVKNVIGAFNF